MKIFLLLMLIVSNVSAATSEEERANKKYELSIQLGYDYTALTSQFSGMHFLNPNNLVGFKLGTGAADDESQTNISIMSQHYISNSFYIAPEIYYLNTTENEVWVINQMFNIKSESANYTSMGAGIRIGNQWTWKHFTLGCDWFGIGKRIGTFHKDSAYLKNVTYTFFNLKIGASF